MSTSGRYRTSIVWMRRDLRLDDHRALFEAATRSERFVCAFVLDDALLRGPRVGAPIVQFFFDSLTALRAELRAMDSDLALLDGDFAPELLALARRTGATTLCYNVDYDPEMTARDERVVRELRAGGLQVRAFTDHVYRAANEILQENGRPYVVYTPYAKRWRAALAAQPRLPFDSRVAARNALAPAAAIGVTHAVPQPERYGHASSHQFPAGGSAAARAALADFAASRIDRYADRRNEPAAGGTSRLSPHLRAGTIGIRACVHAALDARAVRAKHAAAQIDAWIGELAWRDFYQQLLVHFPHAAHAPFLEEAAHVEYEYNAAHYAAWCAGRTGYPIVDAAMTQLNATGWMHNRLRMIVASFLTKHLLIDYHEGERYFEQHLADADLAANNGGWQWSASTGVDAAPYFRVFNPTLQGKTFDPRGDFVRTMLPALEKVPARYIHEPWNMPPLVAAAADCMIGRDYPAPIVDHAAARRRAIGVYGAALKRRA
ncbi:MAG: deoxyribodipyrimidine photo-lyase [Candidatus Velthaea sp.]